MRRIAALVLLVAFATAATSASAAPKPTVSATPKHVGVKAIQTVTGRHWPVIEFCSRIVRVSVQSAQNSAPVRTVRVHDDGTFRLRYIPRNRNIGAGKWRLVARMHCESGKDGSPVPVTASVAIRIG